jgi:putative oxidoreductase
VIRSKESLTRAVWRLCLWSEARNSDHIVRRLFSTFAHGAPGAGLLLLRLAAGIALASHAVMALHSGPSVRPTVLNLICGVVGILLLLGLWTPVAGTVLATLALLSALMHPPDPWNCIFLGTLGAALALVGPGAWSVDAYLFGWKRI